MAAPRMRSAVGLAHRVSRVCLPNGRQEGDDRRAARRHAASPSPAAPGFLGTALIERLLRCVPGCQLVLLIRPGRRSTVEQRAKREIFGNNAFDRLREELGRDGFAADGRGPRHRRSPATWAPTGSASTTPAAPRWRSATSSSTPPPRCRSTRRSTRAVEVNLLGPTRIVETLHDLGVTPHLVSVSTCYVAGNRRGAAPEIPVHESPFFIDVDWRGEVRGRPPGPRRRRGRQPPPDALVRFRKEARHELGAAGIPALAAKTEQRRGAWVKEQMVEAGRARAASLGWPDAYAYTKALGERALLQNRGDVPVSIVRPSIIESSIQEPFPGWIRGFRMAEPVIISYARGLLKEFPGVPEGTVDVIPVDLVVAAIIDAAAGEPPAEPTHHAGGVGLGEPAAVPPPRRPGEHVLHRAPDLRRRGPADHRPRVVVPRPRAACSASSSGPRAPSSGASACSRRSPSAASRPRGRPPSRRSARRSTGPSPTSSSTAPTPSARRSTASTGCSSGGTPSTRRTRPRSASTRG